MKPIYVYVHPFHRPYRCCFTVGVQSFYVCERDEEIEARFYVNMLMHAFTSTGLQPIADYSPFIKEQIEKELEGQ